MSILVLNTFNHSLDQRLATLNIPPNIQQLLDEQRIKLAEPEIPVAINAELTTILKQAIALAFVDSFRLVMFIAVGLALLSAIVALVMLKKQPKSQFR